MRTIIFTRILLLAFLFAPALIWAQEDCPNSIWYAIDNCSLVAEIDNFIEGEEVIWYFNDGTEPVTGGHFIEHTYSTPGVFQLCAFYTSPLCPNGVELCTEDIIVEGCGNPCELDVEVDDQDCNLWVFYAGNYPEDAILHWSVNEEVVQEDVNVFTFEANELATYEICAFYETPDCPEGVFWCTAVEGINCEEDCPNEIWFEIDGCHLVAEIASFVEGEEVIWYYGDGTVEEGGHFTDHDYAEDGYYQVTAYYTSPLCPNGVELWTEDFWVDGCGNDPCELEISYYEEDCNWYVFVADNYPENAEIFWLINGEFIEETGNDIAIEVPENEVVDVCAFYETPDCPNGVYACTAVEGELCDDDCPQQIWFELDGCGLVAEIASFVEGESVIWYYGDGTEEEGGHFTDHEYTESGYYELCAYYMSPLCPEGVEICTEAFYVEGCGEECTPVTFAIDAYITEGAPSAVIWEISNSEGTVNETGVSQFSEDDPYFDGELCLPNGCYTMEVNPMGNNGEITLDNVFSAFFENGEQLDYTYGPEVVEGVMLYSFGINSDCGEEDCYLEVEALPQEDGSWFFEAFPSDDDALVIWNFGDGTDASGLEVPHIFENPGIYEVCAYFETDACPEGVWQCVTVVVGEDGECTPVNFILTALEPIEESIEIGWSLEGDGETQYGEFMLHADCQSTVLNLCLINGCYVIEFDLPGGEESVPMWLAMMVNNQLVEQVNIEPGTESVVMDFGINTDCFNNITENSSGISVYPIPARDVVHVIAESRTPVQWTLTAMNGAVVMSEVNTKPVFSIPVNQLAEGMYVLNLIMNNKLETHRIQVIR